MRRDIKLYVNDIDILEIERFVGGMNFEEFKRDDKTLSAVMREFEIIGEDTKHIPDEIRQKYPDIPWKACFMDKLIFTSALNTNLCEVWNTIKMELSELKNRIKKC